jgi:predicted HTH transcriptional regulator
MLKDFAISANAEKKIEGDLELNVFVITTGVWPSTISVWAEKPRLPPEVEHAETEFIKLYSVANPKRSIKFVHSMSSAIVKYKQKELVCSVAQALILNLFNEFESLSTESILTDCRIPESELLRALNALVEAGVVIGQGKIYHVNPQFKFPTGMIRLALNQYQYRRPAGSTPFSEEERAQTESSVNEDRLHQLDAAIVRIMKRVKKCSHAFLSGEIMESSKYLFSKVEISKRVASLIDREFLERQSGEDGEIRYLA